MKVKPSEYDGFHFTPPESEEKGLRFDFFTLIDDYANGQKIDTTDHGDCWLVAYVKADDDEKIYLDDIFEFVIEDPLNYIHSLIGTGVYGCIVRKTDKSIKWFNNYVENVKNLYAMKGELS